MTRADKELRCCALTVAMHLLGCASGPGQPSAALQPQTASREEAPLVEKTAEKDPQGERAPPSETRAQPEETYTPEPRREAPQKTTTRGAGTAVIRLRDEAPNGEHPKVLVHTRGVPREGPVPVVVFLHGWFGCVDVVAGAEHRPCTPGGKTRFAMDLVRQFDASNVAALLVVPQLPFDQASSAAGRLTKPGQLGRLLRAVLAHPDVAALMGREGAAPLGRVVLQGHSGAYFALGVALERGGVDVAEAHLLDALYLDVPALDPWFTAHSEDFVERRRRMVFLYTEAEKTGPRTLKLVERLASRLDEASRARAVRTGVAAEPPTAEALAGGLVALEVKVAHEKIPPHFLAQLLSSAGLPARD